MVITLIGQILIFGVIPLLIGYMAWEGIREAPRSLRPTHPRWDQAPTAWERSSPTDEIQHGEAPEGSELPEPAVATVGHLEGRIHQLEALALRLEHRENTWAGMEATIQNCSTQIDRFTAAYGLLQERVGEVSHFVQSVSRSADFQARRLTGLEEHLAEMGGDKGELLDRMTELECRVDERLAVMQAGANGAEVPQQYEELERQVQALMDTSERLGELVGDESSEGLSDTLGQVELLVGKLELLEERIGSQDLRLEEQANLSTEQARLLEELVSGQAMVEPDDLTQLEGLGRGSQKILNSFGIVSLPQLAALSDGDLEQLDQRSAGFASRVRRGSWIQQAKAKVARPAKRRRKKANA